MTINVRIFQRPIVVLRSHTTQQNLSPQRECFHEFYTEYASILETTWFHENIYMYMYMRSFADPVGCVNNTGASRTFLDSMLMSRNLFVWLSVPWCFLFVWLSVPWCLMFRRMKSLIDPFICSWFFASFLSLYQKLQRDVGSQEEEILLDQSRLMVVDLKTPHLSLA